METIDKRKFEKGQAIMVNRHKVGGGFENVEATFLRAIPNEDRSWIRIKGTDKDSRKSNQSIFAVGEEYISPEKYYAKNTRKANKKAAEVTAKEGKKADAKKPTMKAEKGGAKTPKLDTSKEPKKLSKIDRVIAALAKNPKYELEQAVADIECTPSCFKQVSIIIKGIQAKADVADIADTLKWEASRIEKVIAKFKAAK